MEKEKKTSEEKNSKVHVWQGYTGKVELVSFSVFKDKQIRKVALGGDHSLFLTYDDCLYTCGSNEFSQLGIQELRKDYIFDPCLVSTLSGKKISDIACGTNHSACICDQGNLFFWGDNRVGQCGVGEETDTVISPEAVLLDTPPSVCHHGVSSPGKRNRVGQVDCGASHSIVLCAEGSVWVWGSGAQLGLGDANAKESKPTVLKKLLGRKVLKVLAGDFHCMALLERSEVTVTGIKGQTSSDSSPSLEVRVHKTEPSTCAKCNEEIYRYTETSDTCIIHEDHFCKEEKDDLDTKSDPSEKSQGQKESSSGNQNKSNNALDLEKDEQKLKDTAGQEMDNDQLKKDGETAEVEMRLKNSQSKHTEPQSLPLPAKNDKSPLSSFTARTARSKSFLDQAGAREFLARQFQDDLSPDSSDLSTSGAYSPKRQTSRETVPPTSPSSPGGYMMEQVTSLTSHMTSQVTSLTSKALSGFKSTVTDKFMFSSEPSPRAVTPKSSTETLSVSDLESGSSENLDKRDIELSDLNITDIADTSLLSESSFVEDESTSASPSKSTKPDTKSSPVWVSKQSQSLRTLEAKQEQLKRRSLSLSSSDADKRHSVCPFVTMETEVWSWGQGKKGQLGHGDMIDRLEPQCVQILSDKRIVKLAVGNHHSMALSAAGEVFTWGLNVSGQLGHQEITSTPYKIQLNEESCVWDIDAGSSHSIFLVDHAGNHDNKPDVFYVGKHPCKDLYVPIYKTSRLTNLKFMKKAGWIRGISSGGDNCASLSYPHTDYAQQLFQLTRFLRDWQLQMNKVVKVIVKRLQLSGFYTTMDVFPYKSMLSNMLSAFISLTQKLTIGSLEETELLRQGESTLHGSVFSDYESYVAEFKKYSTAFSDMVAVGGFEYCTKTGSSTFENLQSVYGELGKNYPTQGKVNHAVVFRKIMQQPFVTLKEFSTLVNQFAEVQNKDSAENNLLTSVYLNWEHFLRTSSGEITMADNTRAFWETGGQKLADNLKIPSRRLIRESKSNPLTVTVTGRFSSHVVYLFNDMLIHSQYSSYQVYPLATVWVDTPSSESSNQQNMIVLTTPEETLTVTTPSSATKVEWLLALNTAINKVLYNQKSVSRQNSSDRLTPPVVRQASHSFIKHALFKDATYSGYWMNGKVHGNGELRWSDGKKYVGKFKHGAQTGYGKMTIPTGDTSEELQEGTWKDGKQNGHGKISYSNGDMYDGNFKDGLRHGHGVYRKGRQINSASFIYVGEWLYNKKHGYGVMDDILKGEKYMGMWQEDNRHGDSIVVTLDGMYFEGNFQHNKMVGFGLMLTDDNSCYEGEFAGITLLQGKGTLTFPSGDKIEGSFNGTWNQGLKVNGTFHKNPASSMSRSYTSMESQSSLYAKLCVRPDRKWEEIFYHCFNALHYSGDGEPNTKKAWDAVAVVIAVSRRKVKEKMSSKSSSKSKNLLSNLESLEKIPPYGQEPLTIEHYLTIVQYLTKAFETPMHPLGKLIEGLVDVFRAAYIGIGAHPRLLFHAVQEIKSYIHRIYRTVRILFPELPKVEGPVQIYPKGVHKPSTPVSEAQGFIQRQFSESDDDVPLEIVSAAGLLQPILLPKIYPPLIDLYALHADREDEKYWERIQKLNKQGDMSLMAYLGIDQAFWCIEESIFKDQHKRLSNLKDHCYSEAVEAIQQISTAFCPQDKLEVIQKTFLSISQVVQNFCGVEQMLCMDDLFPIFQFVVIRARIHHLGAEIHFIEELMESYLELGELGIMFTTLKACYFQIQDEKMPIH